MWFSRPLAELSLFEALRPGVLTPPSRFGVAVPASSGIDGAWNLDNCIHAVLPSAGCARRSPVPWRARPERAMTCGSEPAGAMTLRGGRCGNTSGGSSHKERERRQTEPRRRKCVGHRTSMAGWTPLHRRRCRPVRRTATARNDNTGYQAREVTWTKNFRHSKICWKSWRRILPKCRPKTPPCKRS